MPVRIGEAVWTGTLQEGQGTIKTFSGALNAPYSAAMRFGDQHGTNPEELIGAAHAACFSMALSKLVSKSGFTVEHIETKARVHLKNIDNEFKIMHIDLVTKASIPGITESIFFDLAENTKRNCPVSQALAVPINLEASLK
jgi:osmotically inducible protein OsmC